MEAEASQILPTRYLSLLAVREKTCTCWLPSKPIAHGAGKECPPLVWKYLRDENGLRAYRKTEVHMLFSSRLEGL